MQQNTRLVVNCVALVLAMFGLAYASVPLYRLFCQVTGFGGTTQTAMVAPGAVAGHTVAVRFNADIAPTLAWKFSAGEREKTVRVGEQNLTYYVAENLSDTPVTGMATYNVVPHGAGAYFTKIHCFCFEQQTLAPHQKTNMPVSFFIDPAILDDPEMRNVDTITLSYTFFPVKNQ